MLSKSKKNESQTFYDQKVSAPSFQYKDKNRIQHEVWFEDPRGLLAKFRLTKRIWIIWIRV
ncbi:hypothetical protein COJ46_22985 [Bacillus sp. AFS077874]|nr:hypothetical protein CON00_12225 [Bacillus sp. AFS096315]PFM74694.1 hypothetical protein COJ46_22985 [Bacillus sp. AFS077874]